MRSPVDHLGASLRSGDRTALKSVRYLGSAKEGTGHFIKQRLTALANFVLVIFLAVIAILLSGRTYPEAVALLSSLWVAVPLALAIISVSMHLKIGLQVVIEDYVSSDGPRIALIALNMFFCILVGAAGLFALVKISLASLIGTA